MEALRRASRLDLLQRALLLDGIFPTGLWGRASAGLTGNPGDTEKRRQLDGENGGEDQKTTDRHPDREDLAQEENAAKQPEHGLEPEQESGMAGQGELLRAVLNQETGERRKKGGEADLDEPSGALPYEGVVGDEPHKRRQGGGHQEKNY